MTYGWKLFPTLTPEQSREMLEDLAEKMRCDEHYESDHEQQRKTYFEIAGV